MKTVEEIQKLTIKELVELWEDLAKPDCECDSERVERCQSCEAASILNNVRYTLRREYEELLK